MYINHLFVGFFHLFFLSFFLNTMDNFEASNNTTALPMEDQDQDGTISITYWIAETILKVTKDIVQTIQTPFSSITEED